ncbi:MAG TPA: methyltransferase [Cyclobacteriaceae bacterium]|nr:methyltransferase [Cyclobacteriaceae bacterium]
MRNKKVFHFKKFSVHHDRSSMKVGTDGVLLGAWVDVSNCKNVLDIGMGSGLIALMLAQRTPDHVTIDGIDILQEDFQQASANFLASPWKDKLTAHHIALQDFNPGYQYDCIVTNPPFFSNSLHPPGVKRQVVRHTTSLTFDELLSSTLRLLTPAGGLNLILPLTEGEQFITAASEKGLYCNRIASFRTKASKPVERLLLELSFIEKAITLSEILLYNEAHIPSEEYRSLTAEFYINF